jgi:hypothetical protein
LIRARYDAALASATLLRGELRSEVDQRRQCLRNIARNNLDGGDVETLEGLLRRASQVANALAQCPLRLGGRTGGWKFSVPRPGPRLGGCGPYAATEALSWVFRPFLARLHALGEMCALAYFRRQIVELLQTQALPKPLWGHLDSVVDSSETPRDLAPTYGSDSGVARSEYLRQAASSAISPKQRERYGLAPSGLLTGVGELQEANKWGAFLSDLAQTQGESQCGESHYLATELVAVTFAKVLFGVEAPAPWPALNFCQEAEVGPVLADAGLVRGDSEPFRQTYEARSGLVFLVGSADHLCLLRTSSPSAEPRLATSKRAPSSNPLLGLGSWEVVKEVRRPATRPPPVQLQPQPVGGPATLFVRKRPGLPVAYLQLQPHVALQRELDERGSGLTLPESVTSQLHRGGLTGAFTFVGLGTGILQGEGCSHEI